MTKLSLLAVAVLLAVAPAHADALKIISAGSLRAAMGDLISASGTQATVTYGGSGLDREKLEKGDAQDLFISADMGNPQALTKAGLAGPTVMFVRNQFCAIVRPGLAVTPETLLRTILDPAVKLGTSTPLADPAGDYAWAMFDKAEKVQPGSRAILIAKALKMPGALPVAPRGENQLAWLMREHKVDLFLVYCTGGPDVVAALPGTGVVHLPKELAVSAEYGLAVLNKGDQLKASQFALFVLSPAGQAILAKYGFDAPLLPH